MGHRFHVVDVFATRRYAGNQLAVVEDAGDLDRELMQRVAAEFDFSETTFVGAAPAVGDGDECDPSGVDASIFTPAAEIPFAGHPTLGTAHVVREALADETVDEVVLNLGVGPVPVEVERSGGAETLWMTQQPPSFGEALAHEDLAAVLGLDAAALDDDWPVQVVSTGLPTIVVPLTDRRALTAIEVDRDAYDRVTGERGAKNVLAFCPDPRSAENDLSVRVFAPFYGVPEDPATGSSNGCLAAYLARHRYFGGSSVTARVEQGYETGRPSLLELRAEDAGEAGEAGAADGGDAVSVEVGGQVVPVAEGTLL